MELFISDTFWITVENELISPPIPPNPIPNELKHKEAMVEQHFIADCVDNIHVQP
jgi:hypothetical protein